MTEYRVVVVGAGGVGKSAITVRFIQGTFVQKYDPTIEDSYRKQVEVDGKACLLDIMDTAGQEEYSALRDQYMKTGEGFLLVYSITSKNSFEAATKLRTYILRIKEAPDIPILLVGNKCDLKVQHLLTDQDERAVDKKDAQNIAQKSNMKHIECSAKTEKNIDEIFFEIVRMINLYREKHPEQSPKKDRRCELL